MSSIPKNPKIFHITHTDNLPTIASISLWSDAERIRRSLTCKVVGMTEIKRRRREELEVDCNPGTKVGDYVPFFFCPRSIMLYLLHMGNHPDLTYSGGQQPIIHLQADLKAVVEWAEGSGARWAFANINAGARMALFFNDLKKLDKLDWKAIETNNWRAPDIKERKQAEFLVEKCLPWNQVELIGTINARVAEQVEEAIAEQRYKPKVVVKHGWYYP